MSKRDDRMWALGRSVGRVLTELGRELILAAQEQEAESLAPPSVGERELVVGWLDRMAHGQGNIGVPTDGLELLADAIKAGRHTEELEQERVATRAPFPNADEPARKPPFWPRPEYAHPPDLLDEPDLAQAPTTPGAGPVPLFVDEDQELDAQIDSDSKFERDLAYVAPEQWNAEDARRLERIYQERGDVLPEQTQRRCNQLLGRVVVNAGGVGGGRGGAGGDGRVVVVSPAGVLTDEQCRELVANGQRTEDEMAREREAKKSGTWQPGPDIPETNQDWAVVTVPGQEQVRLPITKEQREAFDALQAEATRLNEQERRGG